MLNGKRSFTELPVFLFIQELIKDLQTAKRQTWGERERLSEHYDEERRVTLANKVNFSLQCQYTVQQTGDEN